jgi:hypothetical protein
MKPILLFVLSAASLAAAHGGNTDSAITWTLYSGYQPITVNGVTVIQNCAPGPGCISSAITGDNGGLYIDGQSGVTNSVIHFSSGTYDATLGFANNSTRAIGFSLSGRLAYNSATTQPSWATQTVSGKGFLNVGHILYPATALGSGLEDDYTTRFSSQLPVSGTYHLRMNSDNPVPDAPASSWWGTFDYNDPYETALVHVHHCPDTTSSTIAFSAWCPAGHKESWYVYPDAGPQGAGSTSTPPMTPTGLAPTQVATLVSETSKGPTVTTSITGQYSAPFFFKIELK